MQIAVDQEISTALQCWEIAAISSDELPKGSCVGETFNVVFPRKTYGNVRGCVVRVVGFQLIPGAVCRPHHIVVPTCLPFKAEARKKKKS